MVRYSSSSSKEEQQVPDSIDSESSRVLNGETPMRSNDNNGDNVIDILDELEGILGIEDGDNVLGSGNMYGNIDEFNFMDDWDEFRIEEDQQFKDEDEVDDNDDDDDDYYGMMINNNTSQSLDEESRYCNINAIKREKFAFEEEKVSSNSNLNLNLNYQEVMDAWSDRGSLWANDDYSLSMASNTFMGEVPVVPVMEEEQTRRAKVLRYKEKRQSRLFSKKIRYQVRKLNAEKRPRLKGRFVKRAPEKIFIR